MNGESPGSPESVPQEPVAHSRAAADSTAPNPTAPGSTALGPATRDPTAGPTRTVQAGNRRRLRRALIAGLAAGAILLALSIGAIVSWSFSSEVLAANDLPDTTSATVLSISNGKVVLADSRDTDRPGIYSLRWRGGHALIEGVLASGSGEVTRRLTGLTGRLVAGMHVTLDSDDYTGNPTQALGLPFSEVRVPGQLGSMPAWLIPGRRSTWAIVVHGLNGNREGDLNFAPPLYRAGLPALLITYREDAGAPRSPDGLHHMGLTEWRDLQAAAGYALAHGARRLVLIGCSMGGAIVTQFMERSPLARYVSGLVLDAPALSWKAILSFNASEMGLPSFAALPVEWAIDARIKPNWRAADALDHPANFHLPILLFHGTEDELVPLSLSRAYARELKPWVTLYVVPRAGHCESWNVDPGLYDRRLTAFLARLDR